MILNVALSLGLAMAAPTVVDAPRSETWQLPTLSDEDYVWSRYAITPKVDRHGSFEGKDELAADKRGMSRFEYVVGGVDKDFIRRLAAMMRAMQGDGLNPGITSLFRDDFRQGIAKGRKSAVGNSFHGGSRRGGYGSGLAADIVSLAGTRSQQLADNAALWSWVDSNGKAFGIGRPYGNRDAPHIGPIDGREFASRGGGKHKARRLAKLSKKKGVKMANHKRHTSKKIRMAKH